MQLNSTDRKVLPFLQDNAKLTIEEIASKIQLSVTPTYERIRKLEKEGVIDQYVCLLNPKKVRESNLVYCQVTLEIETKKESFETFNVAIQQMKEVIECHVVSGNYDYLLKVLVEDGEFYNHFYQNKLSVLPSVLHISSYFVISEIKQTTKVPVG